MKTRPEARRLNPFQRDAPQADQIAITISCNIVIFIVTFVALAAHCGNAVKGAESLVTAY
jgi:hypothetical protein